MRLRKIQLQCQLFVDIERSKEFVKDESLLKIWVIDFFSPEVYHCKMYESVKMNNCQAQNVVSVCCYLYTSIATFHTRIVSKIVEDGPPE